VTVGEGWRPRLIHAVKECSMVTAKTGRPRRGGLVLTQFLTVREVALSGAFDVDIFGGESCAVTCATPTAT
jgi:hypothetical protein